MGVVACPPLKVEEIQKKLNNKIWYRLSRNSKAESCKDAASKRERLGYVGIPLWDELKSLVFDFSIEGIKIFAVVHLRGDKLVSIDKVIALLRKAYGEKLTYIGKADLKPFGLDYGLVNPFFFDELISGCENICTIHLLDDDLFSLVSIPHTMMTNAGDFYWSIEFHPESLLDIIPLSLHGDISEASDSFFLRRRQKTLGIVTGNTPESGALLWQMINQNIRERMKGRCLGDLSFPRVLIYSIPEMGLAIDLDIRKDQVWDSLRKSVMSLDESGVDYLAISCNSAQYFSAEVEALVSSKNRKALSNDLGGRMFFISMAECTAEFLVKNKIKEVSLVGVSHLMDAKFSEYLRVFDKYGICAHVSEDVARMSRNLSFKVKDKGALPSFIGDLNKIISCSEATHIVLALSEISQLLKSVRKKPNYSNKVIIDPLEVYSQRLAAMITE